MLEYKHYLENQYNKIYSKIIGDQSIAVFKDLDNKEFMHRRVNQIFEKTYNAERQNYIKKLIQENNILKEQIKSLGGTVTLSLHPSTSRVSVTNKQDDLDKTMLIKESEQMKTKLIKSQLQFQNQKQRLRKQIIQLQQLNKALQMKKTSHVQEWKQKEAKLLESFKQFIEQNKNLQTQILDLKERLDGQKLKQNVSSSDNQNYRKKIRQVQAENREMVNNLNTYLNQIKTLNITNTKLIKDNSFLEHKLNLLEQQKQHLRIQLSNLGETKQEQYNDNYRLLQFQYETKEALIKKLESNVASLNKQLEQKSEQVSMWKQNYQNSLKDNNIQKVKLKYEYQMLELQNKLSQNQHEYEKQLNKRSVNANNIIKQQVVSMQNNKHKQRIQYSNKINTLTKDKYQLQEEIRILYKQIDQLESVCRNNKVEHQKEINKLRIQNDTIKTSTTTKQNQYKQNIKNLQSHILSLKNNLSIEADKMNEVVISMVVLKRENKQLKDLYTRQTQKGKQSEVIGLKKDLNVKELEKQIQQKQKCYRQLLSNLNIETQQKNEYRARLVQQKCTNQHLTSQINKLKIQILKNQSNLSTVQVKYRTNIKQIVQQHQLQIQRIKSQITLQVHQQIRAIQQLSMNEKSKSQITHKYEKGQLQRLYKQNNQLKQSHSYDMLQLKEQSDNLKQIQNEIKHIKQEQLIRSQQLKHQIDLLKQQNQISLNSLMVSKSQVHQYKTKITQFRQQMNLVIKGILKMFWEDAINIRQQFVIFQKQQINTMETYRIDLTEKVRQYTNMVNNKLKQAYNLDCKDLKVKMNKQSALQNEQWQQKYKKLQLDYMALQAQRQMQKAQISKKIKIKQSQIEIQQDNFEQLQRRNQQLQELCSKYPMIIKKLEQKNKQLSDLVHVHKYQQTKIKIKFQREQQRSKKEKQQYQIQLQNHKTKYIQDNQQLFNRYEKSLQDMITKTSISETNFEETISFKTPLRKQTSITNLRQQISQQKNRLKQLSKK